MRILSEIPISLEEVVKLSEVKRVDVHLLEKDT
jgi:hypothetical protein